YALTLLSVLIPRRARPTLLPYTTLFRSEGGAAAHEAVVATRGLEREPVAQLPGHLVGMAAVDLPERLGAALAKSTQQRPRPPVGRGGIGVGLGLHGHVEGGLSGRARFGLGRGDFVYHGLEPGSTGQDRGIPGVRRNGGRVGFGRMSVGMGTPSGPASSVVGGDGPGRIDVAVAAVLTIVSGLFFGFHRSRWLDDWDSIQFALALERLSLTEHRPHPPGY